MAAPPPPHLDALRARVARLPKKPGVYLWKDEAGRTLYVGKASDLRARTRSYLGSGSRERPWVHLLVRRARDVEVVTTSNPEEALLLENTLIKKEQPPYNLRLKDDKAYLLVRVDHRHPFPRLTLVRRAKKDGARYVGPFASARSLRRTLTFLRTLHPLRTCSDRELAERTRPCLYHQIGRCAAPCIGAIPPQAYARHVEETLAVLRGRDDGLLDRLRAEMHRASDGLRYERAALLRDRAKALETSLERQRTVRADGRDRDVFGVAAAGGVSMIGLVYVRDGHVVAVRSLPHRTALARSEVLTAFLSHFYARGRIVPPEVLVGEALVDPEGLGEVLEGLRSGRVRLRRPNRGADRDLVRMAERHAAEALEEHSARARQVRAALVRLGEVLGLSGPPARIEGYDLSHFGGKDAVAAMAVLEGGVPEPSSYRHFAIREARGGDDYAGMFETVRRRFHGNAARGARPDLLLIDGGLGQVEAARRPLADTRHRAVPVVGLAKARPAKGQPHERIVRPGHRDVLVLPETDPALRLLVRVRDEAHRFAGRYQRHRRSKAQVRTLLDDVAGVGPKRRQMLLERFGSVAALERASLEDLAALPGIGERRARLIRERLNDAAEAKAPRTSQEEAAS
ncbi:MAG: excinuclease ABC subunit UvrC [Planctomycetota bacterium]